MKPLFKYSFGFMLLLSLSSYAQTSSTTDGNWSTGGNWTAGVPEKDEVVTVSNDMTVDQDIEVDTDGSFTITGSAIDPPGGSDYSLTVQGEGILVIDGDVTFGGDLNLKNNSSITVKGCDTLTIGGNAVHENNSSLTVESCAVLIVEGDLEMKNNLGMVINGQVKVEGDLTASNSAEATGTGNVQVDGTTDFSNGSNLFGNNGGCTDCDFGGGNPLPITLAFFDAYYNSNSIVEVVWVTLSEINNHFFTLEYSLDGLSYFEVAEVEGAGNSFVRIEYREQLLLPSNFKGYIRLKQTDYDGQQKTFDPVYVHQAKMGSKPFILTNNPRSGQRVRMILQASTEQSTLLILDMAGKEVYRKEYYTEIPAGSSIELPDLSTFGPGVYFIQLESNNQAYHQLYILQ